MTVETNEPAIESIVETPVEQYSSEGMPVLPEVVEEGPVVNEIIIGAELSDSDREEVYRRLGRPDTPEGYDISEIVPETYSQDVIEQFKQKAHEAGMTPDGVKKMAQWYKELEIQQQEAIVKSRREQDERHLLELKRDFGVKFDEEVQNARKALDAYTDKAFRQYMDNTGLGNHPALVKAFAKIGRELSEDKLVQSETATRLAKNEELVRSEISRLRSDQAFMERYRRGDPAAVQRLNRLYLED